MKNTENIDFVLCWVDGNDPEWIKEFNKYTQYQISGSDSRSERYKDYGLLKYWFRAVETYAPWVHKVHFITCGQKPEWLNENAPKLNWVKHNDYIPSEYLPVFSSHPIEIFMHKIPNLSEKFVYFNDDLFLLNHIKPSYFFKKNLPCDSASFGVIGIAKGQNRIPHIQLNNMIEINKNFSKNKVLKKHFFKWFNLKNGKFSLKNIFTLPFKCIPSITIRHFAQPYLKSTFETVWQNCNEVLTLTANHKFRNKLEDVNQWLFRYWQLCEGNFIPCNHSKNEKNIHISAWTEKDNQSIIKHKYTILCLDDDTDENECIDYEKKMESITKAFEKILPNKSSFEL